MNDSSFLVRHKTDHHLADPISTPIFQTSAFRSGDPYFYTRKSNPNFEEVEDVLKQLDQAERAVLVSSGMAAISAAMGLLAPGDEVVVNTLIYGCSHRFLGDYGRDHGVTVQFADLMDYERLGEAITAKTTMVFFETPTNPFLRTVDIRRVSDMLHQRNPEGIVVVDNTWATPLFQKPLVLGADLCVYSCSKFFSGHSDIILGAITTSNPIFAEKVEKFRFYSGAVPDPFAAWLLRRSLQTLAIRMDRHVSSTKVVAEYLGSHRRIVDVLYPHVDGGQLSAYGGLLFARLAVSDYEEVRTFMEALRLFDTGTSMASVASAVACPYYGSHLSMSAEAKAAIGLDPFLVRLSVGLEDPTDLIEDLSQALGQIG